MADSNTSSNGQDERRRTMGFDSRNALLNSAAKRREKSAKIKNLGFMRVLVNKLTLQLVSPVILKNPF